MKRNMKLGFMAALLGGLMFFSSCGDDNEEIIPTNPDATYDAMLRLTQDGTGDTTSATVNVNANTQNTIKARVTFITNDIDMKRLYITQNEAGQGDEPFEITAAVDKKADGSIDIAGANANGIVYALDLPVPSGIGSGTVVYQLWTTTGRGDYRDQNKRLALGVGTITLNYGGTNSAATVKSYSAKMLAAPLADGTSKTFISLLNGDIYTIKQGAEYAAFWDFGYYYGAQGLASLASTQSYPSSIIDVNTLSGLTDDDLNKAYFDISTTTSAEFDAITTAGQLDFIVKPTDQVINNLSIGDIIEFVDAYGKKGLIKVTDLAPGNGSGDFIEISIKVQP